MPTKLMRMPQALQDRDFFGVFDDFDHFVSADTWTKVVSDVAGGVGIAVADGVGGVLTVSPEDATDNDEVYLRTTAEIFKFAANKPIVYEARATFAEQNTDDANVFFGMMNAIAGDALVDNGGGVKSSFSGAAFFKVDGSTLWSVITSIGTTRTVTELSAANSIDKTAHTAGSASAQVLRIEVLPRDATNQTVLFYINDVLVAEHDMAFASATEMHAGLGLKNGSTTAETMSVDYIGCWQQR